MRVKAAPDIRFPREDKPRTYIEQDPVDVPDTAYYQKALVDGDLVAVAAPAAAVVAPPTLKPAPAGSATAADATNS